MRKSFHKWVLAAGIVSASTLASNQAFAAWCSITTEWIQQHVRTETNLIKEVKELETNVAFEGATTLEQVLAALKVVNRQYAGEEQRLQQVVKKSQEAYANTVTEQMRNERLVKIKEDYSYETGQGANACAQVAFLGRVTSVLDGTPSDASAIYKNLDVSPENRTVILETTCSNQKGEFVLTGTATVMAPDREVQWTETSSYGPSSIHAGRYDAFVRLLKATGCVSPATPMIPIHRQATGASPVCSAQSMG